MGGVRRAVVGFVLLALTGCASTDVQPPDPLSSWNQTATRNTIVGFVEDVTREGSPRYVPPDERIATFDNDGTLWAEQPIYFEILFAMDRIREMVPEHPEWRTTEPFASALSGDPARVAMLPQPQLFELILATHAGMTETAFEQVADQWFATARHPRLNRPFQTLVYQPQLELLRYLRANGFKTFIVSGGEVDFMRAFAPEAYEIPPEQIKGTTVEFSFTEVDGQPVLTRMPAIDINGDHTGKPINIHLGIGRKPILAFGNSDGDMEMLEYTDSGSGPRLMLLLHHDDAQREFAYDRQSHVGRLDKAWDMAKQRGWIVVSMKNDFATIFPSEAANDN
ncbi:MAG TPA: HAD family hydrolase [Geminicoccus sp.]|jgi:hypothetical protein|uniref:HAD family hydrolase n=1 Tax=Geminicoccus sp. TaxID=2024832 RepID=UPI002E36E975|nr:HAD family hydrolase [Geminicoccus sp.]HEX2526053.1 HAD family hydrolase [Geminicoccus sp.]